MSWDLHVWEMERRSLFESFVREMPPRMLSLVPFRSTKGAVPTMIRTGGAHEPQANKLWNCV